MLYSLENSILHITVNSHGAELRSLTEKADAAEYLWNGDPAWWKYTSPVLFPIIGKLTDGTCTINGKTYSLPAHGLGRISDFSLLKQTDDSLTFALDWSTASLQIYPYKFRLEIQYTLQDNQVIVQWLVRNLDAKPMDFSIGAHPALLCPIDQESTLEDCFLRFNRAEHSDKYCITPECLLLHEKTGSLNGTELPLSYEFFKNGVAVYDDLKSDAITICSRKSKKAITIQAKGFPYWGIWAPERGGAPFICLEPWFGHADFADFHGDFHDKEGNLTLAAGKSFFASYSFIIQQG